MAFKPAATSWILALLCVFLTKGNSAQREPSVVPVAPIAPFGPLGNHVTPGPIEFVAIGPAPTADILTAISANIIPNTPSLIEQSIADLVPAGPPVGCTLVHVSSYASPIQIAVNHPIPVPGSSVEIVEPLIVIETAQCGCAVIRLYWVHEIFTLCPLGTGRWAKTQILGQAELVHEWILHNVHDVQPPCALHNAPSYYPK